MIPVIKYCKKNNQSTIIIADSSPILAIVSEPCHWINESHKQGFAYSGTQTYIKTHSHINIQSSLKMTQKDLHHVVVQIGRLHASCSICSPIRHRAASAGDRCTTRWSSCIIILPTGSRHLFLHADAVGSWHIPDDSDRLSLTLARAAGAAAHDWHTDGQKSSKPAVLTTRPSAASCLIGWWALW